MGCKGELRIWDVHDFWGSLAGIWPQYADGHGDSTEILLEDGQILRDSRPVPLVLKEIAFCAGQSVPLLRERYGALIGKKKYVPLPINLSTVLLPFQSRIPRIRTDSATGYIVTRYVTSVVDREGNTCLILLSNGRQVKCLQSGHFIRRQMRRAQTVQAFYRMFTLGCDHLLNGFAKEREPESPCHRCCLRR